MTRREGGECVTDLTNPDSINNNKKNKEIKIKSGKKKQTKKQIYNKHKMTTKRKKKLKIWRLFYSFFFF